MKNYIADVSTLVLMAGLPGVGKSTLAAQLGVMLEWVVLDRDVIKTVLVDAGMDEEQAGWIAYDMFFALAHKIVMQQHHSLILDTSALHPFILERATAIAQSANAQLKVILCTADSTTRMKRLRERNDQNWRAKIHTVIFDKECCYFSHLPTDILVLSTVAPFEDYLAQAISYLQS
jgi:predicted kinase